MWENPSFIEKHGKFSAKKLLNIQSELCETSSLKEKLYDVTSERFKVFNDAETH